MMTAIVEFELLCIAVACFWWAAKGYDHIVWRKE